MSRIRKPIITVLGHVDSGKSSLLDTIRGTRLVEKEAGGITQHIGATEVPTELILDMSSELLKKYGFELKIPGLLFIDTPGHEAFTNLRARGGSIADLAILVVDVMHGCQPQTFEAIDILKTYKTPFIVAMNKIDNIRGWSTRKGPVTGGIREQAKDVLDFMDIKLYELVGQLHGKGFVSERFDRVKNLTREIPIIPICAKSGEGVPELLMFLAGLSQRYMEKKLEAGENKTGRGTVLEVKEERGLGKTLDVILYEGSLKVGDTIVTVGKDGAITAKVRALLEPKALAEIRSPRDKFRSISKVVAAAGVKVAAPDIGKTLPGSPILVVQTGKEIEEIEKEVRGLNTSSDEPGPVIKADALGSLEAMEKLLGQKGIKAKKADIGDVSKRDVAEMESIKEKNPLKAVIFAFGVGINEDAREEAEKAGILIFRGDVIYRLLEEYDDWVKETKEIEKAKVLESVSWPAKFKVLRNNVFRNSKPAIVGVKVLGGKLKKGIEGMKEGRIIGEVKAIQKDGKGVESANEGDEVAVSIDGATIGRNLMEGDVLLSFIPKRHMKKLEEMENDLSAGEITLISEIKKAEIKAEA